MIRDCKINTIKNDGLMNAGGLLGFLPGHLRMHHILLLLLSLMSLCWGPAAHACGAIETPLYANIRYSLNGPNGPWYSGNPPAVCSGQIIHFKAVMPDGTEIQNTIDYDDHQGQKFDIAAYAWVFDWHGGPPPPLGGDQTPVSHQFNTPGTFTVHLSVEDMDNTGYTDDLEQHADVVVTVVGPPVITVQPSPATQSICQGSTATYSVTATGTGLTYQWEKKNGVNWEAITTATTNTYITGEAGEYHCVVRSNSSTGTCGSDTSATVTLTVNAPPDITDHPDSVTVNAGDTVQFTVAATGAELTYQWESSIDGSTWNPITGATETSYSLNAAVEDGGKQFRCVVSGSCGNPVPSDPATLSVVSYSYLEGNPGTVFTFQPINQSVYKITPGGTVQISVSVRDQDEKLINGASNSWVNDGVSFQWTATGGSPTSTNGTTSEASGVYTSTFNWTAPSQPGSYMVSVVANDDGPSDGIGADDPHDVSKHTYTFEVKVQDVVSWQPTHTYSSPISGDIDGDGSEELVVVGADGKVHAWNGDGSYVTGWPQNISAGYTAGLTKWPTAAIGDIDGDSISGSPANFEVVVGSPDSPYVYAFHGENGNPVAGWPMLTKFGFSNGPVVADVLCNDVEGKKSDEVVAVDSGGNVYVWKWNNSPVIGEAKSIMAWSSSLEAIPVVVSASPVAEDINRDGIPDIIVGSQTPVGSNAKYRLYALSGDNGEPVSGWPKELDSAIESTAAVANLDADSYPDVVVGCNGDAVKSSVSVFLSAGGSFSIVTGSPVKSSPAIVDLDGNGNDNDIVFATVDGKLFAYHGTSAEPVTGWTTSGVNLGSAVYSSPVVGDLDSNAADMEIAIGTDGKQIQIVNHDGTLAVSHPVGGKVRGAPLICNLDNTDDSELVAGADSGSIYQFDMASGTYNRVLWPCFRQDKGGTGADIPNKAQVGTFGGIVKTETTNIPIGGANVVVKRSDDSTADTCVTKNDGSYMVTGLTIGSGVQYRVVVAKTGYSTYDSGLKPLDMPGQFIRVDATLAKEDGGGLTISQLLPSGPVTDTRRPTISAQITDIDDIGTSESGIDASSIQLRVDKKFVSFTFTPGQDESGTVSYTPLMDLAYGLHTVELSVSDNAGNGPEKAFWTFVVSKPASAITSGWSMFMHDPLHTGFLGGTMHSGEGGKLYRAWDASVPVCQTGDSTLSQHYTPGYETEILNHPYLDSSPVVYDLDGTPVVYVGFFNESTSKGGIMAYHATGGSSGAGQLLWTRTFDNCGVSGTPVVAKIGENAHRVFFGTDMGYVFSIDAKDGTPIWSEQTETSNHKPIYSSLTIGDGILWYVHELGRVYGLSVLDSPAQRRVLTQPCGLFGPNSKVGGTSIAYENDGTNKYLYVGTDVGRLYKLRYDEEHQELVESKCAVLRGPIESSPTISGDTLYVGVSLDKPTDDTAYNIYALYKSNLSYKWAQQLDSEVVTTPAVAFGQVYVGTHEGWLYALSMDKGKINWKSNLGNYVIGSCAVSESGIVYATCCDDDDATLDHSSTGGEAAVYTFQAESSVEEPVYLDRWVASDYYTTTNDNTSFRSSPAIANIYNPGTGAYDKWVYVTSRAGDGKLIAFRQEIDKRIYTAEPFIHVPGQEVVRPTINGAPKNPINEGVVVNLQCPAQDLDTEWANGQVVNKVSDGVTWYWEIVGYDDEAQGYFDTRHNAESTLPWKTPNRVGRYVIKCIVEDDNDYYTADDVRVEDEVTIYVQRPVGKGTIVGKVLDNNTSAGIDNALVQTGVKQGYSEESTGYFSLKDITPGIYNVYASKPMYTGDCEPNVNVEASRATEQVILKLTKATNGNIQGSVFRLIRDTYVEVSVIKTGERISNATVTLMQGTNTIGSRETDSNGSYRFDNVEPGDYTITVTKTCYDMRDCVTGADISSPVPVSLAAGEQKNQDFCLEATDTQAPNLTYPTPTPNTSVNTGRVEDMIRCTLADTCSGVDMSTFVMKLNGVVVDPTWEVGSGGVIDVDYTPISVLSPGLHEVGVTVSDYAGNTLRYSWQFSVGGTALTVEERSWPMFHRDARHSGFIQGPANDPSNESLAVGWMAGHPTKCYNSSMDGVHDVDSSPVFSAATGHVYAGTYFDGLEGSGYTSGDMRAYDALTGELAWKYPADTIVSGVVNTRYIGAVSSTPAVAKVGTTGDVYRVFFLSRDGHLYCVAANDDTSSNKRMGELCWIYPRTGVEALNVQEEFPSSPVVDTASNTVYFVARSADNDLGLYSIDATTGASKWMSPYPLECGGTDANSSPALDGSGNLYVRADEALFKLNDLNNASGPGQVWKYEYLSGKYTCSAPVLKADGSKLYIGQGSTVVMAIDVSKGPNDSGFVIWSKTTSDKGEIASTPAVAPLGGESNPLHIYSGTCSGQAINLFLDSSSGDTYDSLWNGYRSYVSTSPAVTGSGLIYAGCDGYIGPMLGYSSSIDSTSGALYCVHASLLESTWNLEGLATFSPYSVISSRPDGGESLCVRSSPAVGYVERDGKLERWVYILTRANHGTLFAFRPDPNQPTPSLIVSGEDSYTSDTVYKGQADVVVKHLRLKAAGGQVKVAAVRLARIGNAESSAVSRVRLVKDVNHDGLLNGSDYTLGQIANYAFSTGTAHRIEINETHESSYTSVKPLIVPAGDTADLLVVLDIASAAVAGQTVGVEVKDTTSELAIEVENGSVSPENLDIKSRELVIADTVATYDSYPSISILSLPQSQTVKPGATVPLSASAEDYDSLEKNGQFERLEADAVTYKWKSNSPNGGFMTGQTATGDVVNWTAPYTTGSYVITLTVSDRDDYSARDDRDSATATIEVTVEGTPAPCAVDGTVTSAKDGGQISGATVTLSNLTETYSTLTDGSGHYSLSQIPYGPYVLITSAAGYEDNFTEVNLSQPGSVAKVNVSLAPKQSDQWKSISGTVVYKGTATGVDGAIVYAGTSTSRVETNSNGTFTLYVPPATTEDVIYAEYPDWNWGSLEVTSLPATGCIIEISPRFSKIQGQVTRVTGGTPLANAYVVARMNSESGELVASALTDASGNYVLSRINPDVCTSYYVRAEKELYTAGYSNVSVTEKGKTYDECNFALASDDNTAPVISNCSPVTYGNPKSLIKATVVDLGVGVDPANTVMYFDTVDPPVQTVAASYNAATGLFSYAPPSDLVDDDYYVKIHAVDYMDNASDRSWNFNVSSGGSFEVEITAPANGAVIEPSTEAPLYPVIGRIANTFSNAYPINYSVKVRRNGTNDEFVSIGSGSVSGEVQGYTLCNWETRALENGTYDVKLVAVDSTGREDESDIHWCVVGGDLKIGSFGYMEEPDIAASYRGLPFEVRRIYNSQRISSAPFYYGWTWAYDIEVEECVSMSCGQNYYDENQVPFGNVTVRMPNGETIVFQGQTNALWGNRVWYHADGVQMLLTRNTHWPSEYWLDDRCQPVYTLQVPGGVKYQFEMEPNQSILTPCADSPGPYTSKLKSITDRYGNQVLITEDSQAHTITVSNNSDDREIVLTLDSITGRATKAELFADASHSTAVRTVKYSRGTDGKTWTVTKSGDEVANENGVLEPQDLKTEYRYDDNYRLTGIVRPNQVGFGDRPLIQNVYNTDGTLAVTKEWVTDTYFKVKTNDYSYAGTSATTVSDIYVGIHANSTTSMTQNSYGTVESASVTPSGESTPTITAQAGTYETNTVPGEINDLTLPGAISSTYDMDGDGTVEEGETKTTSVDYTKWDNDDTPDIPPADAIYGLVCKTIEPLDAVSSITKEYKRYNAFQEPRETVAGTESILRKYGYADGTRPSPDPETGIINDYDCPYLVQEDVSAEGGPLSTNYTYYTSDSARSLVNTLTGPNCGDYRTRTIYSYDPNGFASETTTETIPAAGGSAISSIVSARYQNDACGEALKQASGRGEIIRRTYDDVGRLWKEETFNDPEWRSADLSSSSYPSGDPLTTTIYGYDKNGNQTMVKTISNDTSLPTVWNQTVYNRDNSQSFTKNLLTGSQTTTSLTYETDGSGYTKTDVTTGKDGQGQDVVQTVASRYDSMGRLSQVDQSCGNTVLSTQKYEYYDSGLKRSHQVLDGTDVLSQTDYVYDMAGRLTKTTSVVETGQSRITETAYDVMGNVVRRKIPGDNFIHYAYDGAKLLSESFPTTSSTGPGLTRVAYEYYDDGQLKQQTQYDNDAANTPLAKSKYTYDGQSRLTKVEQWMGDSNWVPTVYDYADEPGDEFTVPGIDCKFDQRITDAEKRCTYYAHDPQGRQTMVLYPNSSFEKYTYYADGRLKTKSVYDPGKGGSDYSLITYRYNQIGQLVAKCYPGDTYDIPQRIEYEYDGFGRIFKITDNRTKGHAGDAVGSTILYEYDGLGRADRITLQDHKVIDYDYYPTGSRRSVKVTDSTGTIYYNAYTYDKLGRIKSVTDTETPDDPVATYEYRDSTSGSVTEITYDRISSSAIARTYTMDPSGRIQSIVNAAGGTTVSSFNYAAVGALEGIDGLGRRRSAQEVLGSNTYEATYVYDNLSRLKGYTLTKNGSPIDSQNYTFDDVGNRLTRNSETYSYQNAVQYAETVSGAHSDILSDDETYSYLYDGNGNITKKISKSDESDYWLYSYDYDNKMVQAKQYVNGSAALTVSYTYDPLGNLVKRDDGVTVTDYTVDIALGLPVVLIETDGTTIAKYTYGNDLLKVSRNGEYYYFYDGLGSTRTIYQADGTPGVVAQYVYDPYGKLSTESVDGATWNNYLFTGQAYDRATELIYLRARHYDPGTGRFTSRDTLDGLDVWPLSLHRYLYCSDEPVNRIDPSGHSWLTEKVSVTAIQGFLFANWFTCLNVADFIGGVILGDALPPHMSLIPGGAMGRLSREVGEQATKEGLECVTRWLTRFKPGDYCNAFKRYYGLDSLTINGIMHEVHHILPKAEWIRKVFPDKFIDNIGNLAAIPAEFHRTVISPAWTRFRYKPEIKQLIDQVEAGSEKAAEELREKILDFKKTLDSAIKEKMWKP